MRGSPSTPPGSTATATPPVASTGAATPSRGSSRLSTTTGRCRRRSCSCWTPGKPRGWPPGRAARRLSSWARTRRRGRSTRCWAPGTTSPSPSSVSTATARAGWCGCRRAAGANSARGPSRCWARPSTRRRRASETRRGRPGSSAAWSGGRPSSCLSRHCSTTRRSRWSNSGPGRASHGRCSRPISWRRTRSAASTNRSGAGPGWPAVRPAGPEPSTGAGDAAADHPRSDLRRRGPPGR